MFISKVFDWAQSNFWDHNIRQSFDAKEAQYSYIQRPCSWTRRVFAVVQGVFIAIGALFSHRARMAAKECFLKAYYGYSIDITIRVEKLFLKGIFEGFQDEAPGLDELQSVFLKSAHASLLLMANLGLGLETQCPKLSAYLNKANPTAGERLSLYLRLVEAISSQQPASVAICPGFVENCLESFYILQKGLSASGWQIRARDETGRAIASIGAAEFASSIDLCDQLNTYRRLLYMQGFLDLVLQNCDQVPKALLGLSQLRSVTIEDSAQWPKNINQLYRLQYLHIVNCQLSESEDLSAIGELKVVEIKGHRSPHVPVNLCQHPTITALLIEGAITSIPIPGPHVEHYQVQPNSRGVLLPDLYSHKNLKWFYWPFAMIEEMRKSGPMILPSGFRVRYL